jgi:flagellar hook-associated protein 2
MSTSIDLTSSKLDVQTIVESIIYADKAPVRSMQSKITTLQSKISAYQSLNTKLSSLSDKVNTILYRSTEAPNKTPYTYEARLADSIFAQCAVTSSNESAVLATTADATVSGDYSISVTSLAQAKSMISSGFADTGTTTLGVGAITITTGSGSPVEITITSANNTLSGVRDSINAAKAGVTATIINDGSASNPYKLLLRSEDTGTANAFTITNTLTGGAGLTATQTQAAADAEFSVNGVSIKKSSNTISDVIDGVTFTLKEKTSSPVMLKVERDTDAIINAMKSFVTSFNTVNSFVSSQFAYSADKETSGILSGDSTLRRIQSNLQTLITQSVSNRYTTDYGVVSQLGIKFNSDGTLALEESKLRAALVDDFTGVTSLFLGNGTAMGSASASDSRVVYGGKTSATTAGEYSVAIASLAEQASVSGNQAFSGALDGEVLTIATNSGTYTASLNSSLSLNDALTAINASLSGHGVTATSDNGTIKLTSTEYGSAQTISVTSNLDGSGSGFATSAISDAGSDIVGTINGHAATGSGKTLTGATGQAEEGLNLVVSQTTTGNYGTVTVAPYSEGIEGESIFMNLFSALDGITDPLSGPIHNAEDGFNRNIDYLEDSIADYELRLETEEKLLYTMYNGANDALKLLDVNTSELSSLISSLDS